MKIDAHFKETPETGARHRSGREGSPNRSRDRKGALLALPIELTLPDGRGSDWSTPYARIFSIGRHLQESLTSKSRTHGTAKSSFLRISCYPGNLPNNLIIPGAEIREMGRAALLLVAEYYDTLAARAGLRPPTSLDLPRAVR